MPFFSFCLLFACFLLCLGAALLSLPRETRGQARLRVAGPPQMAEAGSLILFGGLSLACFVLTAALVARNFSFLYVVEHSDKDLHLFYRITALWAGQEGALLFWAWCASLFTVAFQFTARYKALSPNVKQWFWSLFFVLMGFMCLLLTSWNNPFVEALPPPADGMGLNPLLQNVGMIFHPPLLFMGYGAFTVPCCLALAGLLTLRGQGKKNAVPPLAWAAQTRPFIMGAWLLLSAGIILGAWWSYMELGWGGYWAWDPVENSSLVPWLIATAYLHTAMVENARGKLYRSNAFLMALVTISAFFSTYLVRGGVVNSVHAFGQSAVGMPLLLFVLLFLAFASFAAISAPATGEGLESPLSREGLLTCTAWIFLALAVVITLGTLWPVISRLWSEKPMGLSRSFYNTTCLPLFAALSILLAACPWVSWTGAVRQKGLLLFVAAVFAAGGAMLFFLGFSKPVPLAGAASAIAVMAGLCMLFAASPALAKSLPSLAAHGAHLGFAFMVLGVAFSGPYKAQEDIVLRQGQHAVFGDYILHLAAVRGGDSHDHAAGVQSGMHPDHTANPPKYIYSEAVVAVSRQGEPLGELRPQLRLYEAYSDKPFSEVDTIFSWGNELYCSMIGIDQSGTATLQVSINPLVNWIWLGGALLCLFPFLGLGPRRITRSRED